MIELPGEFAEYNEVVAEGVAAICPLKQGMQRSEQPTC
jgi:hypothetical protein